VAAAAAAVCICSALTFYTAAYGKAAEINAYTQLTESLVCAFDQWHDWQPSNNVRERELYVAMHGGKLRFGKYCALLPLSAIEMCIVNMAAELVCVQVLQQWSHIQSAWVMDCWHRQAKAARRRLRL
jgi:hypothetical protein